MPARAFSLQCPPRPPWYLWPEYLRYACPLRPSLTGVPPTPSVLGSWVVFWFAPSGGFEPTTFEFRVGRLNHSATQAKGSCEHPPSNIYTPRPIYDFHPRPLPRAQAKFLTHASPYLAVMALGFLDLLRGSWVKCHLGARPKVLFLGPTTRILGEMTHY